PPTPPTALPPTAQELPAPSLAQTALLLLFDNTGCQDDFEILNEIITPLFENNILDNKSLKKYFGNSPLSRWK
ncbi:hypothetical protein, partial [Escherichia coli]|uniref:hypothetical protein n=1 Tax=Escherichia coli TaxID=562 RepID=UPI000BE536DC